MYMDDISFDAPVGMFPTHLIIVVKAFIIDTYSVTDVGSLLYFNSQIAYVEGQKIQVRVSAEVLNPLTGEMKTTNVFHFTYEIREGKPKMIIPKTYHEGKSF